ncbi:pimeloyl-ACP methyl ester carboxylesterase [Actinoplanes lutulentus]|uniref:alpha/beta hydrolase n=1 Tax=Actinoplanes lutulentus TaxID=1287878 RepID=UPI0017EDFFA7|nr:alpha/beta hydrolase [Actinoplanes lutulentus]MBB2942803.1 pimeloyl-ACP methyl ester carboxylesterase [Actinoplanes lutulentus]
MPPPQRYDNAAVIRWEPCPEDAKAQCGTMRVPADWSQPYGSSIELTLARRPAGDPARRIGVLMVNPGGPGASAVNQALDTEFFGSEVERRFDIVGIDPRGVGRSAPILCSQDLVDAKPSPLAANETEFARLGTYNRRLAKDCASRSGPAFHHAGTDNVARDMDAVRVALGEQKISFYGASYGSLIGQLYAERYPTRLRALVLDSVMDHSSGIEDFLGRTAESAQDSFEQFVVWCGRDTQCALHGRDVKAIWARLMERAAAGTLNDPYDPPAKLRVWELISAAFSAFYDPQWFSFAHYLKEAYEPAPAGRRALPDLDLTPHAFPAVMCRDWALPVGGWSGYQKLLAGAAAKAPQMRASPLALTAVSGCEGWPDPPSDPQHPIPASDVPVLVVNSRHDPATAYAWAKNVARQLGPKTRLVTYDGWGHVAYGHSDCVSGAADRYLTALTLPATGTTCPPVEPVPYGVG